VSLSPDHCYYQLMGITDLAPTVRIALGCHLVGAKITQSNIRICPDCNSLFLIERKPRADKIFHCSIQCGRNAATRRYREKNKVELRAQEQERNHQRYSKKKKRQPGMKNVKIARHPQKKQRKQNRPLLSVIGGERKGE